MMPIRDLPLDGEGPAYLQIYRALREAIHQGRAGAGSRLPATRALADELGVSRTTVLGAYDQLLAEGYAVARTGSGTYVAPRLPDAPRAAAQEPTPPAATPPRLSAFAKRLADPPWGFPVENARTARFDFLHCVPDLDRLPSDAFRKLAARRLQHTRLADWSYANPAGHRDLRREIADYLARARALETSPERILVVSGVAQALDLIARLFLDPGTPALLEEPHYAAARNAFGAAGARIVTAPVDDEGIDLTALPRRVGKRVRLAYVTPSHQFPTGSVLSLGRRLALLAWASEHDAYLIEDDYDSEFRYGGPAIESLKSLDRGDRVIYAGTFSKTLYPGLRVAYLVAPEPLVEPLRRAKHLADWTAPTLGQELLTEFLRSGEYERHVRRARTLYGRRRTHLFEALERELGGVAQWRDTRAGLHLLLRIPGLPAERFPALARAARARDAQVYSAAPCYATPPEATELLMGFGRLPEDAIDAGVARLAEAIDETSRVRG